MGVLARTVLLLLIAFLLLPTNLVCGRHVAREDKNHHNEREDKASNYQNKAKNEKSIRGRPYTLQIAGSKLPDCSHACGSCSPCRLVMVSFICASIQEAETCPMAYKCMCNNKAFPVP